MSNGIANLQLRDDFRQRLAEIALKCLIKFFEEGFLDQDGMRLSHESSPPFGPTAPSASLFLFALIQYSIPSPAGLLSDCEEVVDASNDFFRIEWFVEHHLGCSLNHFFNV